ncbi:MAG TPA: shikimate kinase, partial [Gemmatales bacterium]|nr:shikimate kinase [Gemmatales bacterium]
APQLAQALDYNFVELDQLLEHKSGLSIPEMFRILGESYFRQQESELLFQVSRQPKQVVSTGGGIILNPVNCQVMRDTGLVIWLKCSAETLSQRLAHATFDRPPLTNKAPAEEVRYLLEKRWPIYERTAHFEVDTDTQNLEDTLKQLLRHVQEYFHV